MFDHWVQLSPHPCGSFGRQGTERAAKTRLAARDPVPGSYPMGFSDFSP